MENTKGGEVENTKRASWSAKHGFSGRPANRVTPLEEMPGGKEE